MKKNCIVCVEPFETKNDKREVCSLYCWHTLLRFRGIAPKICTACRAPLTGGQRRRKQFFCSRACSLKGKRKPEILRGRYVTCVQCGASFYASPGRGCFTTRKFCSNRCKIQYKKDNLQYDLDFLDADSELRAYFLGLFVTDGCFAAATKNIIFQMTDYELLLQLKERTKYEHNIIRQRRKDRPNSKDIYRISYSGKISQKMIEFGFTPGKKTGKEFIPSCVSETTFRHFLRGTIDGDGCLYVDKKGALFATLVSTSKEFLEAILDRLQKDGIIVGGSIKLSRSKKKKRKIPLYILLFAHWDSLAICKYMYKDCTIFLKRKHAKYVTGKKYRALRYSSWQEKLTQRSSEHGCWAALG